MADPIRLSDRVSEVVSLLNAFKQETQQSSDAQKVNELLADLINVLQRVAEQARLLGERTRRAGAIDAIEQRIEIEGGVPLDLFFSQVGSAVMKAQRTLDERADAAILSPDPSSAVPPVLYSIPTVHAEMKVGFSQVNSRGVNLLVFNNQQQKQNFSESTISFDIVAAPVPPNQSRMGGETGRGALPVAPTAKPGLSATVTSTEPTLEGGAATGLGFNLEGGAATGEPELPTPERTPRHVVRTPTLPLRDEARDAAIDLLLKEVRGTDRAHLRAVRSEIVVVPPQPIAGRVETLLYLCPGSSAAKAAAARKAFRCYFGERTESGPLVLRRPHRPGDRAPNGRAYSGDGLVVPAPPVRPAARPAIPAVAGGVGSVLMHVVRAVLAFRVAWALDAAEDRDLIAQIDRKLPSSVPPLTAPPDEWAALADPGRQGPQFREWVVVRPVFAPGTLEWSQVHVVGVAERGGARIRWPHVHIPDGDTLERWRSTSSKKLTSLGDSLEPLLRRLTTLIADASR